MKLNLDDLGAGLPTAGSQSRVSCAEDANSASLAFLKMASDWIGAVLKVPTCAASGVCLRLTNSQKTSRVHSEIKMTWPSTPTPSQNKRRARP